MKLFNQLLVFCLAVSVSLISAELLYNKHQKPKHSLAKLINKNLQSSCAQALQQVAYLPETCAYKYLDRIAAYFQEKSELLFVSPQNYTLINTFIATYGLNVTTFDSFGLNGRDWYGNSQFEASTLNLQFPETAKSNVFVKGFTKSSSSFYYSLSLRSNVGAQIYVILVLPLENDPIFC